MVLREKEQELTQLRAEMAAKRQELRQVQAQLQSAELQILDKDDEIIVRVSPVVIPTITAAHWNLSSSSLFTLNCVAVSKGSRRERDSSTYSM